MVKTINVIVSGLRTIHPSRESSVKIIAGTPKVNSATNKYVPTQNFWGIGGMKIFRDLIYQMRGMMRADHKFFKSHGQYDFPQKKWRTSMMMYLVGWMMNNRKVRARLGNRINEGMVAPYSKLLEQK